MLLKKISSILTLVLSCFATTVNAEPPKILDLLKVPTHSDVSLSPSGAFLAFTYAETSVQCVDRHGQAIAGKTTCNENRKQYFANYKIVTYDVEKATVLSILPLPENFFPRWLTWANEDRILANIARRSTTNNRGSRVSFGGSRIISLPRKRGEFVTLFEDQRMMSRSNFSISTVTSLLRDDPDHVLIPATQGGDLDLWKVNVNNGDIEKIGTGRPRTFRWFADKDGKPVIRFDTNSQGTRTTAFSWSDTSKKWEKLRTFKVRRRNEQEELEFRTIAAAKKPNQLYVISDEDEGTRSAVKIFDLKENAFVETIFEDEKYDVSAAILDTKTGDFFGVRYYKDRLHTIYTDKK